MKVDDPKLQGLASGQISGTAGVDASERQKKTSGAAGPGDRVSLSSLSSRLRELQSDSPERAAYLERLSADVAEGRYNVDPLEVGRKIVSETISASGETSPAEE